MNVSAEVAVIGAAILDVVVPGAGPRRDSMARSVRN